MSTTYLTLSYNGITVEKRPKDIFKTLSELKPDVLTEMYITVKRGDDIRERRLNLVQARKLFKDDVAREIFVANLLLT